MTDARKLLELAHDRTGPPRPVVTTEAAARSKRGIDRVKIAGPYYAGPGHQRTAPCHNCGVPQPVVMTLARPLDGVPYAICPERDQAACLERGLALLLQQRAAEAVEAAQRAQEAADAATAAPPAPEAEEPPRTAKAKATTKTPSPPPADNPAPGGGDGASEDAT